MNRTALLPSLRRWLLLGAGLALALLPGCSLLFGPSASYVQTGPTRPPLADGAPVRVFLTGPPAERYEELGVVEVKGSDLADRVERAQAEARDRGGNGVLCLSSWVHVSESQSTETVETKDADGKVIATQRVPVSSTTSTPIQTFVVIRLIRKPIAAANPAQ
jgi:hypothetical protein